MTGNCRLSSPQKISVTPFSSYKCHPLPWIFDAPPEIMYYPKCFPFAFPLLKFVSSLFFSEYSPLFGTQNVLICFHFRHCLPLARSQPRFLPQLPYIWRYLFHAAYTSVLNMESVVPSKTHIPAKCNLHIRHRENLESLS
jgi:hypothetical protein